MIRATLDVNVLVSGFTVSSGAPAVLVEQGIGRRFILVLSEHVLTGLADVWQRPSWRTRFHAHEAQRAIGLLRARAACVVPSATVHGIVRDEEDDLVIATAVAGDADYLVTGDRYLQSLGRHQDVTILLPRQFLDLLELKNRPIS